MRNAFVRETLLFVLFGIVRAGAAVSLPSLISDHMALQQGVPVAGLQREGAKP